MEEYKRLKIVERKTEDEVIEIDPKRLMDDVKMEFIQIRWWDEFERKGYFLPEIFDWEIGRDSRGYLVLLPLKKVLNDN